MSISDQYRFDVCRDLGRRKLFCGIRIVLQVIFFFIKSDSRWTSYRIFVFLRVSERTGPTQNSTVEKSLLTTGLRFSMPDILHQVADSRCFYYVLLKYWKMLHIPSYKLYSNGLAFLKFNNKQAVTTFRLFSTLCSTLWIFFNYFTIIRTLTLLFILLLI